VVGEVPGESGSEDIPIQPLKKKKKVGKKSKKKTTPANDTSLRNTMPSVMIDMSRAWAAPLIHYQVDEDLSETSRYEAYTDATYGIWWAKRDLDSTQVTFCVTPLSRIFSPQRI